MKKDEKEPIDVSDIDRPDEEIDKLFPTKDSNLSTSNFSTLNQITQSYSAFNTVNWSNMTYDQLVDSVTKDYIIYAKNKGVTEESVQAYELLQLTNSVAMSLAHLGSTRNDKQRKTLHPMQVSSLLIAFKHVIGITLDDTYRPNSVVLAIYKEDGPKEGIYSFDSVNSDIAKEITKYNLLADKKYIDDVNSFLYRSVEVRKLTYDRNYIPLNNGIYDFTNLCLIPFSPDYVFGAKLPVNYNPLACNVQIKNDDGTYWDVESWINSLTDDSEIANLLWEVIAASIRSNCSWNKAIFFLARSGNNGKGTFCKLIRNIVGNDACVSMCLEDFAQTHTPESLLHASLVIGEENDVGVHLEKLKNFKCVVTHDPYLANIKYGGMKDFRFKGLVIQCINNMMRMQDKTGSFARRLLIIPFDKCFTGDENKKIKDEYLARQDVLEYVVFRALNMRFDEFSNPQACIDALAEQRVYNDPVRQFWDEFREAFVWKLLPLDFLYDFYKSWFNRNIPGVNPIGKNNFMNELREIVGNDSEWMPTAGQKRVEDSMRGISEPLIAEYKLENWFNPNYTGGDVVRRCIPVLKDKYVGLIRKSGSVDSLQSV